MVRSLSLRRRLLGLVVLLLLAVAGVARAEDFRIATNIFVGSAEEPVNSTTTLFSGGVVYDFLTDPEQVAVFRQPGADRPGRFILLDPSRQVRTEVSTNQLSGAMDKLRDWAEKQTDPYLQFAATPEFDESYEAESGELMLVSFVESYKVETTPVTKPTALAEYREFLDWYAQLNTLLHSGPPPGPRLRLNEALARHQVVPVSVELTRTGDKVPIRAEHEFTWRLSQEDRERIDEAQDSLAAFRLIRNDEFLDGLESEPEAE